MPALPGVLRAADTSPVRELFRLRGGCTKLLPSIRQVGPFGGAEFLRDLELATVINIRAVTAAWRTIKRAEPEAIATVEPYGPCAEFIKLARHSGFYPTFVDVSFVDANAFAKELGPEGEGVIVSQVVPSPWDRSLKLVADDQAAQKAFDPRPTPDFVSLEGYFLRPPRSRGAGKGRTRTDACGPVARHQLCRPLRHQGGSTITVSPRTIDTPPKVFLTVIQKGGTFRAVDRL